MAGCPDAFVAELFDELGAAGFVDTWLVDPAALVADGVFVDGVFVDGVFVDGVFVDGVFVDGVFGVDGLDGRGDGALGTADPGGSAGTRVDG